MTFSGPISGVKVIEFAGIGPGPFAAMMLSAQNPPIDAARLDIMPPLLWGRAEGVRTALRTMALRRGSTVRISPSDRPTQSPAPTSRPSCICRPGRRVRTAPASVQTSKAPRWTAASSS